MNTVFEIRSALQWSQSKFADEIGVSFATVNRWENENLRQIVLRRKNALDL